MGKFMIIFPRQITAEQMGFSFEFLVATIIFALGRKFKKFKKTPKISLPSIPYGWGLEAGQGMVFRS